MHASIGFAVTASTRNPFVGKLGPNLAASELNSSIIYKEFRFSCQYNVTLHKNDVYYSSSCSVVRFSDFFFILFRLSMAAFSLDRRLDDFRSTLT